MSLDTLAASLMGAPSGIPAGAVPITGYNATAIDSVTPRQILAGQTGKSIFISSLTIVQPTAAEIAVITIQDNTGTPIVLVGAVLQASSSQTLYFNPPIKVAAGKDVNGKSAASLGDTTVYLNGYVG